MLKIWGGGGLSDIYFMYDVLIITCPAFEGASHLHFQEKHCQRWGLSLGQFKEPSGLL